MFPFDQLGHAAKALWHGAENLGTAVVHTAEDAVHWAGDLFSGDLGTQAAPVPEVVAQMMGGNSSSWSESGGTSTSAASKHSEVAANLSTMLNKLEPAWTGKAAEGARQRTTVFTAAIDSASSAFNANGGNVADAAHGFDRAKGSMDPMGSPPDKSFFDIVTPWDTDTEDAINTYNQKAEKNLGIYNTYAAHLDGQASGLRTDYGQISPVFGDSSDSSTDTGSGGQSRRDTTHSMGTPGGGAHSVTPMVTPPAASPPPGGMPSGGHGVDVPAAGYHPPGGGPGSDLGGGGTSTAGYVPPPAFPPGGNLPGGTSFTPGPGSGAGGFGPGSGGLDYLGGPGGVGGFSGGNSAGGGPGGGVAGGGRQTGAGRGFTEESVRGPGGGVGRAGGSGAAGGPGGMGPGGRGGKKEEDAEHQRKYVQDAETLFTDEDRKLPDPTTGLPPVPPVIGG
ncbi:hypothetical protein OG943_15550 [Amycolatopsis sp. NBC_00345]|uniref:hypothetical protein n=1 Tax=Amycolatopsis sp. NBC_00345 TaxID=2975955 RepID=UPI002E26C0A8